MTFGESIKTCLRKYFVFRGRASRSEYWWFYLFTIIVGLVLTIVDAIIFPAAITEVSDDAQLREILLDSISSDVSPLSDVFDLLTIIPIISAACRRLHDIGRSGWFQILWLVPAIPMIVGAFMMNFATGVSETIGLGVIIVSALIMLGLIIWLIVWLATDSDAGTNRFGDNPKRGNIGDVFT